MRKMSSILSGLSVLALATGLVLAPAASGIGIDSAAAQGKSEDRGNKDSDRGSDRGNSDAAKSNNGNRGNSANAKSKNAERQTGKPQWLLDANGNRIKSNKGKSKDVSLRREEKIKTKNLRAQMGALNAAHANENALANASPNSRVGRIATYRNYMLEGAEAEERSEALDAYYAGLTGDETPEEIADGAREVLADYYTEEELDDLLADVDGAADGAEAADALGDVNDDLMDAADDFTDEEAIGLLEAAANKDLTNEVIAEVNTLLGIEQELLLPEEEPAPTSE